MRQTPLVGAVGLAFFLSACGGSPAPPAPAPPTAAAPQPAPAGPQPAASVTAKEATSPLPTRPEAQYDARGRRDPFDPPSAREGSAGTSVASAKLTGIVQSAGSVLALVETPDGLGYILKPGDVLGDGRVIEIGRDNVVFSVAPRSGSTTSRVVLRLAGD
ncbi:MAG: hypothetical protein AUH29_05325 [Candidatus Rokubacteria bacterium 13_1_40CM_69_27]|nr:MAG: hypothetical protein AUH29_05325 [Candidatus Rokubacteria bacterium 13_1_40CM_69_27]OLC31923.1 MAG: hypothetical protein AUH81_17065 [Candidatus Rokubacteria bacterium 13_1_40CM_4_69_5]